MTFVGTVVGCGCHPLHASAKRFHVARLRYQPAVGECKESTWTRRDGRHADRPADAFVGDRHAKVGPPRIHLERHPADCRDAIDDSQRAVVARGLTNALHIVEDSD
jgi:hypothetical protein